MIRKIIKINEELCDGCGDCANACHEGAIKIIDGKAKLIREDFCDGFGDCLPACHTGAISFEEREALAYNEEEVKKSVLNHNHEHNHQHFSSCPGAMTKAIEREKVAKTNENSGFELVSELQNWPIQIKLAPINAPYFDDAKLLIAADCCAFSYANFHQKFMKDKVTLIACPKLDNIDYSEKLTAIIANNDIKSVTIVRMEVPCCGGLEMMTKKALQGSGKFIPWQVAIVTIDGDLIEM